MYKPLTLLATAILTLALGGCVTTPTGGRELSDSGKSAIQGVAIIGVSRYLREHDNAAKRIANIRAVAIELQKVETFTTVGELRATVEKEIRQRVKDPYDQMDALGLLIVFDPVLQELAGSGQIDEMATIKVREFIDMVLRSLPNIPPPA